MKKTALILIIILIVSMVYAEDFETGKQPLKAGAYSLIIPGAGQFYNDKYLKGFMVIAIDGGLTGMTIYHHDQMIKYKNRLNRSTTPADIGDNKYYYNYYFEKRQSDYWWLGASVFLSAIDAFVDAHLFNYDQKKKEIELRFSEEKLTLTYHF